MAERCASERRIGGVGAGPRSNPHGLTPQEEQITARVADGATNSEVARELSLSTKTVEYHLTRVYRKLGVKTRQALREHLG
ncbi:helix-turn-helix domain-containing protein [Corynebacterium suedekumii]|uniref:Helix-turn-helix transcriptional regulator n=1 Tax=Corynebacterium suedekumii TaxID=3049801 RepID=A0ABY8VNL2_9CORY|nr:helix-turn-helix transcriptional regulator [Corynebacterium suedekumii]WIM70375.1 helix-turn-helix transcriptional regulator [Corynebacterium suedekumii]